MSQQIYINNLHIHTPNILHMQHTCSSLHKHIFAHAHAPWPARAHTQTHTQTYAEKQITRIHFGWFTPVDPLRTFHRVKCSLRLLWRSERCGTVLKSRFHFVVHAAHGVQSKREALLHYFKSCSLTYHLAAIHLKHLKAPEAPHPTLSTHIWSRLALFFFFRPSYFYTYSPKLRVPAIH